MTRRAPEVIVCARTGLDVHFYYGSGARYNFNSRYAISVGLNYMNVSNLYLSEPRFYNYRINVYGPMVGLDVRLGKPKRGSSQ